MTKREMIEAMMAGKTLIDSHKQEASFDDPIDNFVIRKCGMIQSVMSNCDFTGYDWHIKEPKKTRPMTRDEVLGFLANTSGIVVHRQNVDPDWQLARSWNFDKGIDGYEWATITPEGVIGPAMKFEKEVEG